MAIPSLLSLDWLQQHNPSIDWAKGQLRLSCCGANHSNPVSAFGRGYSLAHLPPVTTPTRIHSLGLGLRLNDTQIIPSQPDQVIRKNPPRLPPLDGRLANASINSSVLQPPKYQTGLSRADLRAIWLTSPAPESITLDSDISDNSDTPPVSYDIAFIKPMRFKKYAKNKDAALIWYTPNKGVALRINAMGLDEAPEPGSGTFSTSTTPIDSEIPLPGDPLEPVPPDDIKSSVPPKYHDFLDVFDPVEVQKLPPHRENIDMKIDLEEGKSPPFGPIYSLSEQERIALFDYIEENKHKGFIRKSKSSAAAPILFVKKKTGALRLCVDYRGLNSITKKNKYPLPRTDDLLDRVQGCKIFTVIDLKDAFNLIRIAEGDEWKTAFRTKLGLFEYTVMPFGLTNAPSTFQAFIQDSLRDLLDIECVVYLDDILIFSKDQATHDASVIRVLERLRANGLFANAKKCEFDKSSVEYLGFIISSEGVSMHPKKLATIVDWPEPKTVKDIQSFLGFANFYRRFIDNYSSTVLALHKLTHKDAPRRLPNGLPPEALRSFVALKDAFTQAPILRHFDPYRPSTLVTDASDFAMAGIHLQPDDSGALHPVAFYSRKWAPAEINYDVHDKELLAIVKTFREMRSWLIGTDTPVAVVSDHKNLEYFMSSRLLNRRQARWSMFLMDFNFKLDWLPGKSNPADAPSRRSDFEPKEGDEVLTGQRQSLLSSAHTERISSASSIASISSAPQALCSLSSFSIDNSELLERFKDAYKTDVEWRQSLHTPNSGFTVQGDVVFHNDRIFVPAPLRPEILRSRHDAVIAGHPGRAKTYDLVI